MIVGLLLAALEEVQLVGPGLVRQACLDHPSADLVDSGGAIEEWSIVKLPAVKFAGSFIFRIDNI